ncbi:MAG: protein jag [Christensenellaceae bacterium]|nr:protein jag [Christensenellaceae bacterium]
MNEQTTFEFKGKAVDDAIMNGLTELGLGLDQVDIEIVQEGTKGFLGFGKPAIVRLSKKVTTTNKAEEFLDELLKLMDVSAKAEVTEDENAISINLVGDSTGVLIGRRGETLDALQYLTSLVVNKELDEYKRVVLDTENYRAKREETLVKLANRIATKVSKTGKRVVLEPMNPYERRILHATLQNNDRVETVSEGEEPYRRVVIRKKR